MKKFFLSIKDNLEDWKEKSFPYVLLAIIGYAFYNITLRFVPVDFDDLVLLSSVKNVSNPMSFFLSDWGFGNYGYRPLHSLSLWLTYQIFGVSSGPSQLINIILHILVILLLFALLEKLLSREHWLAALILSCLGLISLYTVSAPTWISDRPTLFVSVFLLILLNYLAHLKEGESLNIWFMSLLSILSLMSKESGLIIPLVCIYFLVFEVNNKQNKSQSILALVTILIIYGVVRFMIFGSKAATYAESGYLFGVRYYENLGMLQGKDRIIAYFENILKNIIAVFLPIFDGQGKISLIGTMLNSLVIIFCTITLFGLSVGKKLNRFQKISLVIIFLNAVIHFQLFRYRTLYIPELAFLIFIASSDVLKENSNYRRNMIFFIAALFLFWNMHLIGENLDFALISRLTQLQQATFESDILSSSARIDAGIVRQIITKYRH